MEDHSNDSMPDEWGLDFFLRALLRELTGTLEDVVGLSEAEGFIALVGQRIGDRMNDYYRAELGSPRIEQKQIGGVLVDLKKRIRGEFFVEQESEDQIVLGNHRCPFGDAVKGRSSLCMMTSNVFGTITAENLGYARVQLDETIAKGDRGCRVIIELNEALDDESSEGREYFASSGRDVD
jgi:predicted ArsR family transcriptional regulator